ncbi:glycosyltransferase [Lachnospiraceae bacterium 62-26]|jgi:Glycosyltransferases involved in cell wall biogenesis
MIILSFLLPVYNTPIKLLKRGIDKLISFNTQEIEILLIDDGSKEVIAQTCDFYARKDTRVRVFHQKNQGVSVARNRGIKHALGKYIVFVDPDDYILDEIFDFEYFKRESSDVILFNYIRKTRDSKEELFSIKDSEEFLNTTELIKNTLFCCNFYDNYYAGAVWAKAFKRKFLINNNIWFDERLRKSQDRVFMLHIYNTTDKVKIGYKTTYVYYENMESICNVYKPNASKRSEAFASAVEKFLKKSNLSDLEIEMLLGKTYLVAYFEILYLDLFNKENPNRYCIRKKIAEEKYIQMDIKNKMNGLSLVDFTGIGDIVKYYLIKNKCLFFLNIIIRYRQNKRK